MLICELLDVIFSSRLEVTFQRFLKFISLLLLGQNSIIIVNGANDYLSVNNIQEANDVISSAKVVVTQLEIKVCVVNFFDS